MPGGGSIIIRKRRGYGGGIEGSHALRRAEGSTCVGEGDLL